MPRRSAASSSSCRRAPHSISRSMLLLAWQRHPRFAAVHSLRWCSLMQASGHKHWMRWGKRGWLAAMDRRIGSHGSHENAEPLPSAIESQYV